jgi:hypothetical protein
MWKMEREMIKNCVIKQMHFSVKDENAIELRHFDLRTTAVWRLTENAHVAVGCDFNVNLK